VPRVRIQRKTDWTLRQAVPDDKEAIKSFYRQNIWKSKDADVLYGWKYEKNPVGETRILVGSNQNHEVIASTMFMPWRLCVKGKILDSCQWIDMFIKLEYRGQTITVQCLEEFRKSDFYICFAFPNQNGEGVHKRLRGIHVGHIVRYTKPIRSEYLVKRYIKQDGIARVISAFLNIILRLFSKDSYYYTAFGKYSVEKAENCGSEFDTLWDRCRHQFDDKIITDKNREYVQWKYVDSPNKDRRVFALRKDNELHGFVVLESTPKAGYIIDMLAQDSKTLDCLIAYAIRYFRKEAKDSVVFIALENNMYLDKLRRFGFLERPETKHFYIYLDEDMPNKEYFQDSKNWFITIGDCDVERL